MIQPHYEVRPAGEPPGEYLSRTGGSTGREFDRASDAARVASNGMPGRRIEVRYLGRSDPARDLLVAAWLDGEPADIRTAGKIAEDERRI